MESLMPGVLSKLLPNVDNVDAKVADEHRYALLQGNELHIRQADLYLRESEELSFYEVLLRARQRREIVIGYRLANVEKAVINPPAKNDKRRWSLKDVFVVIAEKE